MPDYFTMADPFDAAVQLEQAHIEEGAAEGRREGMRAGLAEGRQLGLAKGFEIGVEVGQYAGVVRAWRALQDSHPGRLPSRAERCIASMEELLGRYPLYNPQDERLHELLEQLRGKYKTAMAVLGRAAGEHIASSSPGSGSREQQQQPLTY